MFNHTKDIPFAAAMMTQLICCCGSAEQLPRPNWRLIVLFGIACGCAVGLRVLGYFLISYAAADGCAAHARRGQRAWKEFWINGVPLSFLPRAPPCRSLVAFAIAYLIMIVAVAVGA